MGDSQTGQAGLEGLGQVRDALTARVLRRDGVPAYTLDVDATLIEAEKRDAQWSAQGVKGSMPLLGFLFETPVWLVEELRDGNVSPGAGHLAFYRACQARAARRQADWRLPGRQRLLPGGAHQRPADGVRWAITADQDTAVKVLLRPLPEAAWTTPVPGRGYELAEAVHTMEKTAAAIRLICKRERRRQLALFDEPGTPYGYHVIATNWPVERRPPKPCWTGGLPRRSLPLAHHAGHRFVKPP